MHFNTLSRYASILAVLGHVDAFWRMPCAGPVITERADPVVSPGTVAGHVHTVMGASNFNYSTTFTDLRASDCTSCEIGQDLSSYWVPTLYYHDKTQNTFTDIKQVGGATIYYIQRYGYTGEQLYAFPDGFRMLAGTPSLRSYSGSLAQQAISYHCLNYSNPGLPETHNFPTEACPDGLRQQIFFPSCWDGVNVDSSDHKSHVAYPSNQDSGTCPSTHPYRLVSLFYEVIWNTYPYYSQLTAGTGELVFSNGDPTGYGSHADFVNGWDFDVLQAAVDTCLDDSGVFTDCPLFDIIPASTAAQCKKAPQTSEVTVGTLSALPGSNPVQYGPSDAVTYSFVSTIPAGARISASLGISDASIRNSSQFPTPIVITSKGCYADGYPLLRTMVGLGVYGVFQDAAMTNNLCSTYCLSQGFAYSGTEYTNQCFCANAMPPTALSSAQCDYPCAGDATSMCGGNNALSVSYNSAGAKFVSSVSSSAAPSTTTLSKTTTTTSSSKPAITTTSSKTTLTSTTVRPTTSTTKSSTTSTTSSTTSVKPTTTTTTTMARTTTSSSKTMTTSTSTAAARVGFPVAAQKSSTTVRVGFPAAAVTKTSTTRAGFATSTSTTATSTAPVRVGFKVLQAAVV